MIEEDEDPVAEEEDGSGSAQNASSHGRGRRRISDQWSRVISFEYDNIRAQHIHQLNTDLMLAQNLPRNIRNEENGDW